MSDDLFSDLEQFLSDGGEPAEESVPSLPAYIEFSAESGTLTYAGHTLAVTYIYGTQLGVTISIKLILPPGHDTAIFRPAYFGSNQAWQITIRADDITISGEFVALTYGVVPHGNGGTACALMGGGQVTRSSATNQ